MPPTVQLVGILTLIHGLLLALVGVGLVLVSPLQLMEGEDLGTVIFVAMLGAIWAVGGVLQVVCGTQTLRRRWRHLTIGVNLGVTTATLPMCCALSVGLGVLSTVLLNQDAAVQWFDGTEV